MRKAVLIILFFLLGFMLSSSPRKDYINDGTARQMIQTFFENELAQPEVKIINGDYDPESDEQIFIFTLSANELDNFIFYGNAKIRKRSITNADEVHSLINHFKDEIKFTTWINSTFQESLSFPYRVFASLTENSVDNSNTLSISVATQSAKELDEIKRIVSEMPFPDNVDSVRLNYIEVDILDLIGNNLDLLGCFYAEYQTFNDLFYNAYMNERINDRVETVILP